MSRIDVHAHFLPDFYRDRLAETGHERPDGFWSIPEWSAEAHLTLMDRVGIARAMLSISSPGVHLDTGDAGATTGLARAVNDAGAATVAGHPDRFGLFASLPLPDVDAAVDEIGRVMVDLRADGIVLPTNVADTYLGDDSFGPVWDELDRRAAVVLLHPSSPVCWHATSLGRPRPMIDFLFDTTRAVVDLVLGGVLDAHPGVRLIVPHAGAVLPLVADRVAAFGIVEAPGVDIPAALRGLHVDLAGSVNPESIALLRRMVPDGHVHYGSDHPFTPAAVVESAAANLDQLWSGEELAANTRRLLQR